MSTDDLLDEATRLADNSPGVGVGPLLRALIERVQQAEAERDSLRFELDGARALARKDNEFLLSVRDAAWAERDAARGKLDKVRRLIPTENPELIEAGYGIDSGDVLAILDGKE